jgi:chromosome condensin MukBEF ATPase and DNA-binding subunit MukB
LKAELERIHTDRYGRDFKAARRVIDMKRIEELEAELERLQTRIETQTAVIEDQGRNIFDEGERRRAAEAELERVREGREIDRRILTGLHDHVQARLDRATAALRETRGLLAIRNAGARYVPQALTTLDDALAEIENDNS